MVRFFIFARFRDVSRAILEYLTATDRDFSYHATPSPLIMLTVSKAETENVCKSLDCRAGKARYYVVPIG